MFDPVVNMMQNVLTVFYNITVAMGFANYGLAITLFTLVIKVIIYPLTVKQTKSMKAMQEIAPRQKEIQEKYKGNNEKIQKEIATLYREKGVNPAAGCLPMLLQMAIMIVMFYAIRGYTYEGTSNFLWVESLIDPDKLHILPILAAITTFISQKQTTTSTNIDPSSPQYQQNRIMLIAMPVFFGYICWSFPSGLVLFWVVGNIVQIIQQWWMYRKPGTEIQREAR